MEWAGSERFLSALVSGINEWYQATHKRSEKPRKYLHFRWYALLPLGRATHLQKWACAPSWLSIPLAVAARVAGIARGGPNRNGHPQLHAIAAGYLQPDADRADAGDWMAFLPVPASPRVVHET